MGENSFAYVLEPQFQMNECFAWIHKVLLTLILTDIMWICVIFMNMYLIGCYLKVDIWDKRLSSNIVKAWIKAWVNVARCRELNGKRDCHRSWRRLELSFHSWILGSTGKSWGLSHGVLWKSHAFNVLWFAYAWFSVLIMHISWPCHFVFGVVFLFVSMIFFLFVSWLAFYCFESWELVGKEES